MHVTTPEASGELFALQPGAYGLRRLVVAPGALGPLLDAALAALPALGGNALHLRMDAGARSAQDVEALAARGFLRVAERVEVEALLDALPGDAGTPLTWSPLPTHTPEGLREAAAWLGQVAHGDPEWGDDDPLEVLCGALEDPAFGPDSAAEARSYGDCVVLGALGGVPAALVVAQVGRTNGIGRITYMGVMRPFRGRGLGAWVHRRGFELLRAQGATRYRGGTSSENRAMQRLFERAGCQTLGRLEEWAWRRS